MNYSRIQKWLSSFLIFSILFLQTFEVPLLDSTRAEAKTKADIVSFIVDEDIYTGAVKSKITQYAQDIQEYLPNTRVVIFPVQKTANPFTIASINEKLYYEGDGESGLSRLVGTLLIGEIPLSVVHKEGKAFMSVYPYVDFENKSFVYDQMKKSYEYTDKTLIDEKPEIWHSVIRPNTGDEIKNKGELVNFFKKTHDFYKKQGLFSLANTPTEPRVFYMDTFHDQKTSSPDIWKSYNLYLENIEDITYRRFNKYLAKKIYDASQGFYSLKSSEVGDQKIKSLLEEYAGSTMDFLTAPDITTKEIIEKSVKQFFDVLNAKYMGDILRYVHNTGRYGDGTNVRVDSVPVSIAKKDLFMRTTLKDANTSLEGAIDSIARSSLAKPLIIATAYRVTTTKYTSIENSTSSNSYDPSTSSVLTPSSYTEFYKNYFFGQEANSMTDPKQCTIVRGSTLKVEANRGYGIKNIEPDINLLTADLGRGACFPGSVPATQSYWGGNSPLNFDQNSMKSGKMALKSHIYGDFVKPIYDIAGSKELGTGSLLHIATPMDCLNNNMLLQPYVVTFSEDYFGALRSWPTETNGSRFSCITVHKPLSFVFADYNTYFKNLPIEACTTSKLELDGVIVKQTGGFCLEAENIINNEKTYSFKTLRSSNIMEHKSPTDEEYGIELKEMVTPSLPSDRDRYVDYLDKNNTYRKIIYPNFFRIVLDKNELNYPGANKKIKDLLDSKTAEIKALGGTIDLYKILSNNNDKALNSVIDGVLWNNMKNATLKYAHTLERNLNIDGEKKISADDKKNDYEIAYLGAPGDAQNMYLKVDPEAKSLFPKEVADIMDKVNNYHGLIDGSNISNVEKEAEFKCGPPEGVPIWEWLPAIFCWLGTILPPTISGGSCGGPTNSENNSSSFATAENALDLNKNGILDGYELIDRGELKFLSPTKVFGYGETIPLNVELTNDGKIIDIDNFNIVSFDLKKLTVVSPISSLNSKVVYNSEGTGTTANLANIAHASPYINFKPMQIRAQNGRAKYGFSSKNEDIDVIFDAHILTKDRYGKVIVDKKSDEVKISIRSERISVQSKIKTGNAPIILSSVLEAGNSNGIFFSLKKVNKASVVLSENLPYTLNIYDDISNKIIHDPINIGGSEYHFIDTAFLKKSGVYRFEFIDSKGIKGFTTLTILPATPIKIEVTPASNIFIAGQKTTVLVRILDQFGNIANGEVYTLKGSISGGGGFIDSANKESSSTFSKNIIEGYASFDITNVSVSDTMDLTFRLEGGSNIASESVTLRSIDSAKISMEIDSKNNIVVGKEKHKVSIKVLDKNNQLLDKYNGIISLDFPKLSGTLSKPFVHIKNGISEGDIFLTPGYVAEKNLRIQAQIPGIDTVIGNTVTVLPDVPMSFAFTKANDRMEAKEGNKNPTRATLYDRYGNIAYNTTGYTLNVTIPAESQKYASVSGNSFPFSNGTLDFNILATPLPGRAYIIGKVTPRIEGNSFTVIDKAVDNKPAKTLTISGISQNVTLLDTYYVFNKSKLDTMRYDAQYSVLLGGEYGDITQKNYLGGEILFNHDSKSLAVTTLLNNPWKSADLFGFTPAGKYNYLSKTDDTESLDTTVSDDGTKSFISFYDSYRKEYIARAWLNIDPSITSYIPCTSSGSDISDCPIASQTTVFLKGFNGNTSTGDNGGLKLSSSNNIPLLRIDKNGKMEKYPGIEMELDYKGASNLLGIKLLSNGASVGYLGIKFASESIETVSSSGLQGALLSHINAIVIESLSSRYIARKTHLGISSRGSEGVMFAFGDVSTGEIGVLDRAYLAKSGPISLEDYPTKTGIGWEDTNRMILEVAAGTTIGNATKFYQTFSTITLGDAVSHLPKLATPSHFDRTIGTQISVGNGEQIESYKKIDMNGDSVPDMVIFYEGGKIQLLINYAGSFKDMGYLAYVSDSGKGRKGVGNFFGDKYDDIILTDTKGKLILLDNKSGKLSRIPLVIVNESGSVTEIHGHIQQLEIFDMDADKKSDIVTVDDSGEINILYGTVLADGKHVFTKKLIESGLGLKLSKDSRTDGGAFSFRGLNLPPQESNANKEAGLQHDIIDNLIYYVYRYQGTHTVGDIIENKDTAIRSSVGTDPNDSTKNNTQLAKDISQKIEDIRALASPGYTDFSALDNSERAPERTFIHSTFAEGKGLQVSKSYTPLSQRSSGTLQSGDTVRVEITLTNTRDRIFQDAVYLDSNDENIFSEDQEGEYTIKRNSEKEESKPLKYLIEGDFDYGFDLASIAPGEKIIIQYKIKSNSIAFGKINVGLLEKGEAGDDDYGDISLSPNNICGGELIMWRSIEKRTYEKGTKKFVDTSTLPEELQKNAIDADKNGVPDYIDDLIKSGKSGGDIDILKKYSTDQLAKYNIDKNGNKIPDRGDSKGSSVVSYDASSGNIEIGGLSSGNIDAINSGIDEIVKGLGCGFGGGGCINSPLNWAPLAPGSVPTLFGYPLGSLTPSTGIPMISGLTGMPLYGPWGCIPMPTIWPMSPIGLESTCTTNLPNAGGILGTTSMANAFRIYVTPTITGAVGMAACFGGVSSVSGILPPMGISPLIPGGNCIVAAMPLMSCKDDGSDGDVGSLGLGIESNDPYVNANACVKSSGDTALLPEDRKNLLSYVAGNNARLPEINANMARGGISSITSGPLIGIGTSGGGESDFEVSIDANALANFDMGNILKIKNKRVSAFPDFLMDWANRQLEEVVNKLTSLPTLYIVLPDFSGLDFSGYGKILDKFSEGKSADGKNYAGGLQSNILSKNNSTISGVQGNINSTINANAGTINSIGKNVSGVKAAYEFMSHLPLLKLENEMVDISLPWLSLEEMDKWLIDAKLMQKQWKNELDRAQTEWSKISNLTEADKKVIIQTEGLVSSLQENISIIEDYKKFPEKLQKYLTWKERYASQLLCNIEAIEFMMGGWISDNGKRFRTWVELYILIKAILKGWQGIVDLFYGYEQECATCNNERYDLKHFIFKLISAIIPKIPIIQFPKWPDIWLDLHNIRAGLIILMPEFHFDFVPMILPQLPRLFLPDVPTINIGLPSLPILPRLPELPDLPDLPSLPNIKLPDLPPPPTIPKLFGGIAAVLEIFKIVAKILCIMRINPFVPEWRAGDQIAQITERQGTIPGLDFLNVEFPNFSLSFIDAIKVTTFVNLEFDIDFIVEMSRATLNPLNQFTNDLSNIGGIMIPDVDMSNTIPSNITIPVGPQGYVPKTGPNKNDIMAGLLKKLSFDVLHNFVALNLYMKEHSKEEVTVQGLKDILTENIGLIRAMHDPKALSIADNLQKAVNYKGESETQFIQELTTQNTDKFRFLKDYVKSEQLETLKLKTEIDSILRTGNRDKTASPSFLSLGGENIKAQAFSTENHIGDDVKQKILASNARIFPSLERIKNGGKDMEVQEIEQEGKNLVSGVSSSLSSWARDAKKNDIINTLAYQESSSKLLAIESGKVGDIINAINSLGEKSSVSPTLLGLSSQTNTDILSTASSYKYEGIYILDKNNKQVRLFDYLDGVDSEQELVYTDVDQDGDDDIIYRMDNSLYLKENFEKKPDQNHFSDAPKIKQWQDFLSLGDDGRILSAPNHFEETFIASNQINFSFRPANRLLDKLFRFEYYDYVDRFDRIRSGEVSISPKTPLHKVDLIPDLSDEIVSDTSETSFVGRKNIVSLSKGIGEAFVIMNDYNLITSDTNGNSNPIIISEGRTIYTDNAGATISYIRDGEITPQTLIFDKNTNYEFLKNTKIWVTDGKLYLFKDSFEQKTIDLALLKGMAILPGTKIELNTPMSRIELSYFDGSSLKLDAPGTYEYYPLGKKSEEYSVSLSASNDWFYSQLSSFDKEKISTIASLHLLSPQKESDTEGPLVSYGDIIRLPVYQKQTVNLQSSVEDISGVDNIWIDADLTKDTDGDGNITNDKDSLDSSTKLGIKKGNTIYDLEIGSYDKLFTKKIRLFAEDGNGNISSKDLTLIVYPPIPEIQSLTAGIVSGNLNEVLKSEPIDIFRLRNGVLSRIESASGDILKTTENGLFSMLAKNTSGLTISKSGTAIATIDERTGKITLDDTSLSINVVAATIGSPLLIQIVDGAGAILWKQKMNIKAISHIEKVDNMNNITGTGIFVSPNEGLSFVKNTLLTPTLPGGGYITDINHKALAGISQGGDIYILDPKYTLVYGVQGSFIKLSLQERDKKSIADILYKIDAEFILK